MRGVGIEIGLGVGRSGGLGGRHPDTVSLPAELTTTAFSSCPCSGGRA